MTAMEAKQAVRERDGHKCVDCGKTAADFPGFWRDPLEVHRLAPGSKYTLEGCVLVCDPCHHKRHREIRKVNGHGEKYLTIKGFDKEVLRKLKTILAIQGSDVLVWKHLSDLLRPQVEADYERLIKEEAKKFSKPPKE